MRLSSFLVSSAALATVATVSAVAVPTTASAAAPTRETVQLTRQIHATIDGVLSNGVTGYSLASNGVRNFSFDLVTLTSFSTGSNTVVHQPGGGGSIMLGTGRLQFDDTTGQLVGYNGPTDDGEYDDLCTALS